MNICDDNTCQEIHTICKDNNDNHVLGLECKTLDNHSFPIISKKGEESEIYGSLSKDKFPSLLFKHGECHNILFCQSPEGETEYVSEKYIKGILPQQIGIYKTKDTYGLSFIMIVSLIPVILLCIRRYAPMLINFIKVFNYRNLYIYYEYIRTNLLVYCF